MLDDRDETAQRERAIDEAEKMQIDALRLAAAVDIFLRVARVAPTSAQRLVE